MTRAEFEREAAGLRTVEPDLSDEVVHVEPVSAEYFSDSSRQRCVVRRRGELFLSYYD